MLSTLGEVCCGTTANIIVKRQKDWLTPRLTSGCLPGIMRQQGINQGLLKETEIAAEIKPEDQWLLINSLSCKPIIQINQQSLKPLPDPEALWRSLLTIK